MFKKRKLGKVLLRFLPALIWMGLIFYLSSIPNLKTDLDTVYDMILRKGAHMFEYFVLTLLIWFALEPFQMWRVTKFNLVFIFSFLYAVLDEWHQTFVFSRSGSPWDVGVDTIGIVIGLLAIKFFRKLNR